LNSRNIFPNPIDSQKASQIQFSEPASHPDFSACDSVTHRYNERMKDPPGPQHFATTHWSLVGAVRPDEASRSRARAALEELCRAYWYPLYAFVRSRGYSAVDAQDLTQAFFARFIETDGFASADRERGRFRSYLLGAMKHFLANEWHRAQTQKRGGRVQFIEFDALDPETRYAGASEQSDNPEHLFDREWALQTIAGALQELRDEMTKAGRSEQFDALKSSLTGQDELPRDQIAAQLNMSANAVKVAVHRLRQRYSNLLRAAIAETVSNEADLDDEMRYLIDVLRRR
jgi:RNA polymerase sigma factor (sigma-70 family)